MQDANLYLNKILKKATSDGIVDAVKQIPPEIGTIMLDCKNAQENILYMDWSMRFEQDLDVSRTGNYGKDEIQMIFNLNREAEWRIEENDRTVHMKKGELWIYRDANVTTSMHYEKGCEFLFKSIQISTSHFRELLSHYFPKSQIKQLEQIFLREITSMEITPDMYRILHEMNQAERYMEFKELYMEGKIVELLSVVLHAITYNKTEKIGRGLALSAGDEKSIQEVKHQIDEKPSADYGGEKIAKSIGMSVSRLNKDFSLLYGTSMHSYVIQKRLEYAAALLADRSCNVSEAAVKAGYTNLSHFSNAFKKQYGVLPRDYAKKC